MKHLVCLHVYAVSIPFLITHFLDFDYAYYISDINLQHPYVYGVLIFEAMATYVGQVSVLSLIALFGAATTAMVIHLSPFSQQNHLQD